MFGFRALVVTISVILNVVIVEVTVVICVTRDVTRDNLIEISGMVAKIGRGRSWSGWMGMMGTAKKTGHSISRCPTPIRL